MNNHKGVHMKVRNFLAAICLLGCVSVASAHGSYGFFYDDGDSSISIGKSGAHSAPVAPAPHFEPKHDGPEHRLALPPRRFGHDLRPRFVEHY